MLVPGRRSYNRAYIGRCNHLESSTDSEVNHLLWPTPDENDLVLGLHREVKKASIQVKRCCNARRKDRAGQCPSQALVVPPSSVSPGLKRISSRSLG